MTELEKLEAELAELETRKAEREAARAEKEALSEAREKIVRAKRALEDAEVIERFEDQLGDRGVKWDAVETAAGVVIVRRPHAATFKKFRDAGRYKSKDVEELVRPCVAHPDAQGVTDLLNDYPAVLDRLADVVFSLAEGRAREVAGK